MKVSTAIYSVTHGRPTGIADADGYDVNEDTHWFSWSDISSLITGNDPVPTYAWVMLYACDLYGSKADILSGFHVRSTDGVFLGFGGTLYPYARHTVSPQQLSSLELHAATYFDLMEEGLDAQRALDQTQAAVGGYIPLSGRTLNADNLPMQLWGDAMTTLQWVYLTSGERSTFSAQDYKYADWKWVIEKEVS